MIKKIVLGFCLVFIGLFHAQAQIDLNKIDLNDLNLKDIIGKVMHVQKGFNPKFFLGNTPIDKIVNVADILGLKKNDEVNRLFNTFRTGRTVYKAAAYAGGAIAVYAIVRKMDKAATKSEFNGALYSGLGSIGSGIIVKLLTKGASYQAIDIFNGIAVKTIRDIFSVGPSSEGFGVALYVRLD